MAAEDLLTDLVGEIQSAMLAKLKELKSDDRAYFEETVGVAEGLIGWIIARPDVFDKHVDGVMRSFQSFVIAVRRLDPGFIDAELSSLWQNLDDQFQSVSELYALANPTAYSTDFGWSQFSAEYEAKKQIPLAIRRVIAAQDKRESAIAEREAEVQAQLERLAESIGEATASAQEAKAAAIESRRAAADSGTGALQDAFSEYVENEKKLADRYRLWTLITLGAALLIAGILAIYYLFPHANSQFDIQATAYRIAFVAGLSALAAYLGRQASNHRHKADWAEAVLVQLKSFRAFIAEMDDKHKASMIEMFGRRVLGAPPDAKGGDEVLTNFLPLLVDLAAKRS